LRILRLAAAAAAAAFGGAKVGVSPGDKIVLHVTSTNVLHEFVVLLPSDGAPISLLHKFAAIRTMGFSVHTRIHDSFDSTVTIAPYQPPAVWSWY
jgi:hypothetical protein